MDYYTVQCGIWLWNRDSEFTKWQHHAMWYVALGWHAIEFARWQHPAMWYVALESWHWIHQVAAPCSVAGSSRMTCHWICPKVCHIGILHLVSISTTSPYVILHQAPNRTTLCRKKWRHVDFQDGRSHFRNNEFFEKLNYNLQTA